MQQEVVNQQDTPIMDRWMATQSEEGPVSTNQPALDQPFQRWFKFKEAFSPQFILDCFEEAGKEVKTCLDPFGGSGTTALTCQFYGVRPSTIEVNPFLADLIESKLSSYNFDSLESDLAQVIERYSQVSSPMSLMPTYGPETLVEPGVDARWIFNHDIAETIFSIRKAIDTLSISKNRRLLKVALGAILVDVSNARINGKGRRYRSNWKKREIETKDVSTAFEKNAQLMIQDLKTYSDRPERDFSVLRGDCRKKLGKVNKTDMVIFSPPYPNSFDYTDIYNIELWMLGYLTELPEH